MKRSRGRGTNSGYTVLAAARTCEYHRLETRRMLLEAAACCALQMQPSATRRGLFMLTPASRAAPAQVVEPSHPHACCACPSAAPQVCRLCPKGRSPPRLRRTTLLRVICADDAAVAALPQACSDCCLPVVPDKPRLCTPVVGALTPESTALTLRQLLLRRDGVALLFRRSFQIYYS